MRKRTIYSLFMCLGIMAILTSSCEKYEEGGLVSKTEKNLVGSWKLSMYLKNSTDETNFLLISNYKEVYAEDGKYMRSYIDEEGEAESETGSWSFDKEQKQLIISGVSSIEITEAAGSVSSSYYNLIKLNEEELWYSFTNGSNKHEFHLVKQ